MNQLLFIVFNLAFFLLGRGLVLITSKAVTDKKNIDKIEIFGLPIYIFYPLFSIIFLGNIVFVLNFFFAIEAVLIPIFLLVALITSINLINRPTTQNFKLKTYTFLLIPILLSVSSYGIWLGWDTGLYHLQTQAWIRESNLVIGLSNLNVWLGWSSIYEYLSSLFWLDGNYVLIHFIKIAIYNFLYVFLLHNILFNKNAYLKLSSLGILLFSLLDNVGYLGGANGFPTILTVGKFDEIVGIFLFLTSILFLCSIFEKSYKLEEFVVLIYLSLFCFQLKQNGVTVIFPLMIYIFGYIKKNNISFINLIKSVKLPISLGFLWIIKNILVTSCVLYPISFTCLNFVDWYAIDSNYAAEGWIVTSPIDFNSSEPISRQLTIWLNTSKYGQYAYNFVFSLVIIFVTNKILLRNNKRGPTFGRNHLIALSYVLFLLILWLFSNGANPRYGFGIWLLLISLFYIRYKDIEIKPFISSYIGMITLISILISAALLPRVYSYEGFLDSPMNLSEIGLPWEDDNPSYAGLTETIYLESVYGFEVFSNNGLCWNLALCHHIDKEIIFIENKFFSKFIIP
ncbi:hypothetical protein OAQ05_01310 [Acidimicrobiia bacterium]|nr:hypothetical protein [Acidimicrobiia bacterium]